MVNLANYYEGENRPAFLHVLSVFGYRAWDCCLFYSVPDRPEGPTAGPESARDLLQHHEQIRVATKYPRIARDYFYNKKHQTVEIIKLNGSIELAPILGLSDVIVDIVETGTTLRENGLQVVTEFMPISARFIANKASYQFKHRQMDTMLEKLRDTLHKEEEK